MAGDPKAEKPERQKDGEKRLAPSRTSFLPSASSFAAYNNQDSSEQFGRVEHT